MRKRFWGLKGWQVGHSFTWGWQIIKQQSCPQLVWKTKLWWIEICGVLNRVLKYSWKICAGERRGALQNWQCDMRTESQSKGGGEPRSCHDGHELGPCSGGGHELTLRAPVVSRVLQAQPARDSQSRRSFLGLQRPGVLNSQSEPESWWSLHGHSASRRFSVCFSRKTRMWVLPALLAHLPRFPGRRDGFTPRPDSPEPRLIYSGPFPPCGGSPRSLEARLGWANMVMRILHASSKGKGKAETTSRFWNLESQAYAGHKGSMVPPCSSQRR